MEEETTAERISENKYRFYSNLSESGGGKGEKEKKKRKQHEKERNQPYG